jgi:hypothetical protein
MSSLIGILERLRGLGTGRTLLRAPIPPVALQLDREALSLVRLKPERRGLPVFEASASRLLPSECVPTSIFDAGSGATFDLPDLVRELFESSGTKPGRASLVIPDNLAKISLFSLPERPASRLQLDELVKARLRRSIPFDLKDASLSYQVLPAEDKGITLLVVAVRRTIVEQFEEALSAVGAQLGLVDICTTNLINLTRESMAAAMTAERDVALLNCASNYFSLAIVRGRCLIFFRCKTYAAGERGIGSMEDALGREVANSFAYYRDRLAGKGVGTVFLRSPAAPIDEMTERLLASGVGNVHVIDPTEQLQFSDGATLDVPAAQQLAPAIGAAVGRGK